MKSKQSLYLTFAVMLPTLVVCGTAFGWAGNTHATLCQQTFDDPVVSPLLGGINQSAIETWTGEPGDYQNGQWSNIAARAYIDTGVSPNGLNWNALSETDRLKYMQHNTTDVAVPLGHSPANTVYTNTVAEAILEAQVGTWSTYPSVVGTCNYTHNRNGHSYSFTGTYSDVIDTFYDACIDNATWFKSTKNWLGLHSTTDNRDAAWNGTKIGLMLQRATFVDYFLAKQDIVMEVDNYWGASGGTILFDQSDSYDPDCVSWNSNGTYSQIYGCHDEGLQYFVWDFDMDLVYDYGSYSPYLNVSVDDLIAHGCPTNTTFQYLCLTVDNESKGAWDVGEVYLSTGRSMMGEIGAVPEPATIGLISAGVIALLNRRRKA